MIVVAYSSPVMCVSMYVTVNVDTMAQCPNHVSVHTEQYEVHTFDKYMKFHLGHLYVPQW